MEKKRYYVSVQAGTILENQGDATYEFEIEATDLQVHSLRTLFDQRTEYEFGTFLRGHVVAIPYHFDTENDVYDECLRQIYTALYECGTEVTKNHIQSMGVMNASHM
ncbi:hypothetical protein [Brevibacillus porteri]|uniref:Hydrolase n=1 Tax=Brevibacillus porteri TaxID=2126350 RepID=A0ABX5FNG6_9BACL|nr:hypothetical protein [Brevibacillus porteri]MED1802042.1 hypothetical protein [Brevibacillus porteri]MED2133583.1 hypothetical protein [Brevibacillus porteri]MED2747880.1 hypothetical protein [Brevibacillus porteri]MED2813140.1 hypothetical protein [Brevibacillus porteri]MED2892495.1 hypothetical protein [Brevibacillus porteri]